MTFLHQRTTGLSGAGGGALGENQYASLSAINDAISAEEISEGEIVVAGDTGIAYIVGLNVATKAMCGDVVYSLISNGPLRSLSSIRHSTTDYDTGFIDEVSGTVTY